MRDLVAATCGTQNPLVQLSQHIRGDATRQQDGLGHRMSAFGPGPSRQAPGTFRMGTLLQEMQTIDNGLAGNQWAQEFRPAQQLHSEWDKEFLQSSSKQTGRLGNSTVSPQPGTTQRLYGHYGSFMHNMEKFEQPLGFQSTTVGSTKWAEDILTQSEFKSAAEESNLVKVAKDYVETENSHDVQGTDFYKFVENVANQQQLNPSSAEAAGSSKDATKDDTKFWKDLTDSWSNASFNTFGERWAQEREIMPESYRNYRFNEQTPIDEAAVQNPFEEGLQKLKQGDLPSAVLLFEAAVKKDSSHVEAWQYLGTTQAQNEQDVQAIAALRQCLVLDPQNSVALMSLSVSYFNEGLQRQACEALKQWLRVNPKYSHLITGMEPHLDQGANITTMEKKAHEEITDLYIRAAQIQPENPDADVQSGLGVLLNMSFEFDKAIDCFKAAVSVRPDDAGLWNRLGATLANGGRSAEAIEAYRHALQLYPGYIRARFNLGISCINLSCYDEAAEHFLSALNLQNNAKAEHVGLSSNSAMSDNIWNTLRMSITLMNRPDLYPAVEARDLGELSRIFLKA